MRQHDHLLPVFMAPSDRSINYLTPNSPPAMLYIFSLGAVLPHELRHRACKWKSETGSDITSMTGAWWEGNRRPCPQTTSTPPWTVLLRLLELKRLSKRLSERRGHLEKPPVVVRGKFVRLLLPVVGCVCTSMGRTIRMVLPLFTIGRRLPCVLLEFLGPS